MKKYLYNHTSEETAYYVENYPWGWRLKTQARFWIETSEKANGGQRFVQQTLSPKTGKWCKPKKSTYSNVKIMGLDENDHICTSSLTLYSSEEEIFNFVKKHGENLTDFQKKEIRFLDGHKKAWKHFSVKFKAVPFNETEDEAKKRKEEREKAEKQIMNAIHYYTEKSEVV